MAEVNILMMVDVEAALSSNSLENNIAMVDTTQYLGSNFEGTSELMTALNIGDLVVWSVTSIAPGMTVAIHGFSGQAVRDQYIQPASNPLGEGAFISHFQPPGDSGKGTTLQYTVSLSFQNIVMTFDPFLVVA